MQNLERPYRTDLTARFAPQKLDSLRPELVSLIGEVFTWRYVGVGGHDESYPGQQRWLTLDKRFGGYWCPAEDLESVEA